MWHAHNCYPDFLIKNGEKYKTGNVQTEESYDMYAEEPEGRGVAAHRKSYAPATFVDGAIDIINTYDGTPFFLMLNLNLPHANNEAGYLTGDGMEISSTADFDSLDWPQQEKAFGAIIKFIDQSVSRINAQVENKGIADNTIIIFTSDNGPHNEGGHKADFFDSNGDLRGYKRDLYEGGLRVPMIVKWQGTVAPGSSTNHVSAFWDVLPTFSDIVGQPSPSGIDGISFLPTLLGEPQQEHDFLYWEFYEEGGKQAVLKEDYKYIKLNLRNENGASVESALYNLKYDIGEQKNVAHLNPDIVIEMERIMKQEHEPFPLLDLFSDDGASADTKH